MWANRSNGSKDFFGSVLEDHLRARDPVVELGRDQVADDVARRPAVGRVGRLEPAVRQAVEQPTDDTWRALEQRGRVGEEGVGHRPEPFDAAAWSLRQPPARLFAMIALNIARSARSLIGSPWR